MVLSRINFNLNLKLIDFDFKHGFYTQIYISPTPNFYLKAYKYKSFYLRHTFNKYQFYKISSFKINFFHPKTKDTLIIIPRKKKESRKYSNWSTFWRKRSI